MAGFFVSWRDVMAVRRLLGVPVVGSREVSKGGYPWISAFGQQHNNSSGGS